jgi:hypothetical protein
MDKKPSTQKKSASKRLVAEEESRQTELEILPPEKTNTKDFFKQRKTPTAANQAEI